MNNKIYWHIQMNQPWGRGKGYIDSKKMLLENPPVIGCGEWENYQSDYFTGDDERGLALGDIILVREGKKPLALCKVIGGIFQDETLESKYSHTNFRYVKILDWYKGNDTFSQAQKTIERLMNLNTASWKFIDNLFQNYLKHKVMKEHIELLNIKPQIILQGPPGTGKTRMAELIAKELTTPQSIGNPEFKIEEFFRSFNSRSPEILQKRKEFNKLLQEFQTTFPIAELKNLSIEQYAFGTGDNESFCWWLEYNLSELGLYSGYAKKFLIFWKKDSDVYSKNGFVKDIEDDNEAMKLVAEQISNLVNNYNVDSVLRNLGNGLILKILNSYFPDKYFPINNEKCLNNTLKLFGLDYRGLGLIQKNLTVQKKFEEFKSNFKTDVTNFEFMRFLFDNFDLKGEIEFATKDIITKGEFKLIQFHPAYTYEDFVRGIVASTSGNNIEYRVVDKVLAEFAEKAIDNKSANFVLIIDEINRANLPSVLGELIYALEYRDHTVDSLYCHEEKGRKLTLPPNLYIIGTMNTADRSVGHIDYAIRRRFAFVPVPPDVNVISGVIEEKSLQDKAINLFNSVSELFTKKNESGGSLLFLAPDFKAEDVQIGHSYFLAKGEVELSLKLEYEIKPILREYIKDGVLNENARDLVENLHV